MLTNFFDKNSFLILFIIASLAVAFTIIIGNKDATMYGRMVCLTSLAGYYIKSIKKVNPLFLIMLLCFLLAGALFSFKRSSIYGFLALALGRTLLLFISLRGIKIKDKKLFLRVFFILMFFTSLVLFLVYKNTFSFYVIAYIALITIILISVLFIKLLKTTKRGNLELLSAIVLFLVFDAIFAIQKVQFPYKLNIVLVSLVYNFSYYLICLSMIKDDIFRQKNKA